jgi:hypothetical protein
MVAIQSSPTAARAGHVCYPRSSYLKFRCGAQATSLLPRTIPERAGIAARQRNFNT